VLRFQKEPQVNSHVEKKMGLSSLNTFMSHWLHAWAMKHDKRKFNTTNVERSEILFVSL